MKKTAKVQDELKKLQIKNKNNPNVNITFGFYF